MSRTLQKILLVAAVTSAPSVAFASPETGAPQNKTPSAWTMKSEDGGFFQRLLARVKARAGRADDRATNTQPAALDKLPEWLQRFVDRDDARRSTGS